MDHLVASIRQDCRDTVAAIVNDVDRLIAQPWRIARILWPFEPPLWPRGKTTTAEALIVCLSQLNAEKLRGRSGHWSYDVNRHIALRQAEVALRRMLDAAS